MKWDFAEGARSCTATPTVLARNLQQFSSSSDQVFPVFRIFSVFSVFSVFVYFPYFVFLYIPISCNFYTLPCFPSEFLYCGFSRFLAVSLAVSHADPRRSFTLFIPAVPDAT